jgi:hypothetical protein
MVEGSPAEWLNVVELYDPLAKMRQSHTEFAMPGLFGCRQLLAWVAPAREEAAEGQMAQRGRVPLK